MDICIRRLGEHRGAPRLYLDTLALARAGFAPGASIAVSVDAAQAKVSVRTDAAGSRKVSRKARRGQDVPVIDLNSREDLAVHAGLDAVQVVFAAGHIQILALTSHRLAALRLARLRGRVAAAQPLRAASIAFGAGVTSLALHSGLMATGVGVELAMANEVDPEIAEVGLANNACVVEGTVMVQAPMQEAVADLGLIKRVGCVDILEAGIPCSGASRAGVAKRKLKRMEDHPLVGHLVVSVIQWIAALQPAIVLAENVPDYQHSASAALLRAWLADAGYRVQEVVLDAAAFGSLEARVRWFLVAHPPELDVDLTQLSPRRVPRAQLRDHLDDVPLDDARYRAVNYLKAKAARDALDGKGFAMQLLDSHATRVPTLRKGYHKGGSTDPRLVHPQRPELSRLLSSAEHARIKGIPAQLLDGLSETAGHQVCGQSVDWRPVEVLGERLGEALRLSINLKVPSHAVGLRPTVAA